MVDQGRPVSQDSVIDRVPVTTELPGDLVDAPAVLSDRSRGEAACSIGQGEAGMGDALVDLGPGLVLTVDVSTDEPALVPEQPARSAGDGKVDQFDETSTLRFSNDATRRTPGSRFRSLEVHTDRTVLHVVDAEDGDGGQAHQELAHTRRVRFHGGSPVLMALDTFRLAGPRAFSVDPWLNYPPLISEEPAIYDATVSETSLAELTS
jgi:hypothetical protein